MREFEIGLFDDCRFAESGPRHFPIGRSQQTDLKIRVPRREIRRWHGLRSRTMILRLRMTIGTDARVELHEIRRLVVLDVAARTTLFSHVHRGGVICRNVLMQSARVAIEALLVADAAKRLRVTGLALHFEVAVRGMQRSRSPLHVARQHTRAQPCDRSIASTHQEPGENQTQQQGDGDASPRPRSLAPTDLLERRDERRQRRIVCDRGLTSIVLDRNRRIEVGRRLENLDEHGSEADLVTHVQTRITTQSTVDLRLSGRNTRQQQPGVRAREPGVLQADTLIVAMNLLVSRTSEADHVRIDDSIAGDCNSRRPNLENTNQNTHRLTNRGKR